MELQARLEQLCDFEAILQINQRHGAGFVIAYATAAALRRGNAIIARGAAFHGNGQ
jgi:hypothetical protein